MSFVDAMGYLASLLVLLTFCMRTMLTLRLVAIGSNLAFIGFGFEAAVYPVLVLHLLLLPLNIFHLFKATLISQRAKRAAATDLSADWLRPFMRLRQMKPGEVVFRKGDYADALFLIGAGEVMLPEIQQVLSSGDVFGEIGLFAVNRRRTQSAIAISPVQLLWITSSELKLLCERNPGLSLFFLRLVATRSALNSEMGVRIAYSSDASQHSHNADSNSRLAKVPRAL